MKKQDLINIVVEITSGTKIPTEQIFKTIFYSTANEMAKRGSAEISGF